MENSNVYFRRGEKVSLRSLEESDVPKLLVWINDPELTKYLLRSDPVGFLAEKAWVDQVSKGDRDGYVLGIVENTTGELIGTMGINKIDYRSGTAVTGSMIGEEKHRGLGYGTEAKMLFLGYAFWELNLRKVYSYVFGFNKRSSAYSQKCGYVEEARIPAHYYKNGKYHDQVILAVYRKDWEKLAKKFFAKKV